MLFFEFEESDIYYDDNLTDEEKMDLVYNDMYDEEILNQILGK